jgi:hypothetical protein
MTHESKKPDKPPYITAYIVWLMILGFYQVFLAVEFGGMFMGRDNLLRGEVGATGMQIFYIGTGVLAFILTYGIWKVRPWAFPFGLVLQGMIIGFTLAGLFRWLAINQLLQDQPVLPQLTPILFYALDLVFAFVNLSWAFSVEVRKAFGFMGNG